MVAAEFVIEAENAYLKSNKKLFMSSFQLYKSKFISRRILFDKELIPFPLFVCIERLVATQLPHGT